MTLIYALDAIYICLLSLLDFSYLSYNKFIYKSILYTTKDRQIRVFFTSLICTFSLFICYPLFYLLLNELYKFLRKKEFCIKLRNKKNLEYIKKNMELEKMKTIFGDDYDSNIINSAGTLRETKNSEVKDVNIEENEIKENETDNQGEENLIPQPETPYLKNNDILLYDNNVEK